MSNVTLQHALQHMPEPSGLSIELSQVTDRAMIDLRGSLSDPAFASAVEKVLGGPLPSTPRSSLAYGTKGAFWLSPDQWLLQAPLDEGQTLFSQLQTGLKNTHSLVVDVSHARSIIRLEGAGTREIIMKGAPVNLLSDDFSEGTVRRITFGGIAAMVHYVDASTQRLELYMFRSFAQHAWDWLLATSRKSAELHLYVEQNI